MKTFEVIEEGYEIVITIIAEEDGSLAADAYYKDFDLYRILVIANSTEKIVQLATQELLTNHPFEKVILDY